MYYYCAYNLIGKLLILKSYCITDSINGTNGSDCMRNVLVSVNGALFMNDSIRYQYKPDPIFTRLSPMATIPA